MVSTQNSGIFIGVIVMVWVCCGIFAVGVVFGEEIYINAEGVGDYGTIQAAVDAAVTGDVVILAPGVYSGDGNRDISFLGKAITVRSIDPNDPNVVAETVIDCNGEGRGFVLENNCNDANSVLAGLTIINGYGRFGGGVYCDSRFPRILNCVIKNCSATYKGGGLFLEGREEAVISGCRIEGNTADYGGGIYINYLYEESSIFNCKLNNNEALRDGGGIFC